MNHRDTADIVLLVDETGSMADKPSGPSLSVSAVSDIQPEETSNPVMPDPPSDELFDMPGDVCSPPGRNMRKAADIVLLIDENRDMGKKLNAVKDGVLRFFKTVIASEERVRDKLRVKVVGFRDYEKNGPEKWMHNNPFVSTVEELERQLAEINADDESDAPRSLLDALYTVITVGATALKESPDPDKWRARSTTLRNVVLFTDAPYKSEMAILPWCAPSRGSELEFEDIEQIIYSICKERIVLSVVAPDDPCYLALVEAPCSEYMPLKMSEPDSLTSDMVVEILRKNCRLVKESLS